MWVDMGVCDVQVIKLALVTGVTSCACHQLWRDYGYDLGIGTCGYALVIFGTGFA